MRVLVFFDLPTVTAENKREYIRFRKYLLKSGFIMMQESVYFKMVLNQTAVEAVTLNVKKNKPLEGIVQMMAVTEKQFSKMEYICGEFSTNTLNSDARLVII